MRTRLRCGLCRVDQLQGSSCRIAVATLVLITLINVFTFLQNHQQGSFVLDSNEQLWDRNINFEIANIKNVTRTTNWSYFVPNYVHFVRFGQHRFTYVELICVLAALKNQQPDKIIFHRNHNQTFIGPYWQILSRLKAFTDIVEFNYVELPNEIFGQWIKPSWRRFHGSDVTRIKVLMKYGGIFIDGDSYIIKSLDKFRKYEMTLNWDEGQYLGTQLLIAHKDARFLKLWLESYRGAYRPDLWYYNAGERPTKTILYHRPELVHRVKRVFGADIKLSNKVFQKRWMAWREFYAVHLLIRHQYLWSNLTKNATFPVEFDEHNIGFYPITFRDMAYDVYDIANIEWPKEYKD